MSNPTRPTGVSGPEIGERISFQGGLATVHAGGLRISDQNGGLVAEVAFPMLGRPWISTAGGPGLSCDLHRPADSGDLATAASLAARATEGRIGLLATAAALPTAGSPVAVVTARAEPDGTRVSFDADLAERQLYDVVVRDGSGAWRQVAPHAVYHRSSWSDFGLVHITDMHVARRIDRFRPILLKLGRTEAADKMFNWNDRFRGFVRYANFLHATGALDVIVATGDCYDFQFEDDDDPAGLGNAGFLRDLLLGRAPGPDFPDVEELRVPIFLVPGNHDYRIHPYPLVLDLHLRIPGSPVGKDLQRVKNFSSYNLLDADAYALAQELRGGDEEVPNLSPSQAARAVRVDPEIRPFRQCLAPEGSFVVELGPHRIAMLDSGHDVGMVTNAVDGLFAWLGIAGEDEQTFVGGSPNCEGVADDEYDMVDAALATAPADGLFLVALHAPLFNLWNDEYPYFLRETQRSALPDQRYGYLVRHGIAIQAQFALEDTVRRLHPTWFPGDRDHREPSFVKRGDNDDLLDYGVSRGRSEDLLRLLAGGDGRAADLVLSGHTHFHNEFVVRALPTTGELACYFDFYTANPTYYYPTRFVTEFFTTSGNPSTWSALSDVTYVEVDAEALPDATPWDMPVAAIHGKQLQVPPYPDPLSTTSDPRAWWAAHRPLVLQTGALGPMKDSQVDFAGFRLITVRSNVIDKIDVVLSERLERNGFRMSPADAVRPDPPRQHRHLERSRRYPGLTATGTPASVLVPSISVDNVLFRSRDGHLHELWRQPGDHGTSDLTALASAPAATSDPAIYLNPRGPEVVLPYRGTDGHVHSLYWYTGGVGHDDLSGSVGAPQAAGQPCGFFHEAEGRHYVAYRSGDGHLHSLYWVGAEPVGHEDWSALRPDAPLATTDPVSYVQTAHNTTVVVYRGSDGGIHSLYAAGGPVGHDALSRFAGLPNAAGRPRTYYVPAFDLNQIAYRGQDGHIYELHWQGTAPVQGWSLTGFARAPLAVGDPVCYYDAAVNTNRVIYRSADGHLNELWWAPGGFGPTNVDLTAASLAPRAVDDPTAYAIGATSRHVAYVGEDGQVHEIRY